MTARSLALWPAWRRRATWFKWHPHQHALAISGAFSTDGAFHPLDHWDGQRLMVLFREHLLARFLKRHAVSEALVAKLKAWQHSGFSAFLGKPIASEDKAALEDIAAYLVRSPLSLEKLVYLDGKQAVLYRSKMNPGLGRNFEAMDPLEWLARMVDHVPDPGETRDALLRRLREPHARGAKEPTLPGKEAPPKRKRCTASWARLVAKVYGVDRPPRSVARRA